MSKDQNPTQIIPPSGEPQHAQKYIDWLTELVTKDKLEAYHSDLTKFNIDSMQNHYRVSLTDYEVEVSHSKQTNTGEDMYVMIFNNLKNVATNACERTILSYIRLSKDQFEKFKGVADAQIDRRVRVQQEKQFKEAMAPVDALLDSLSSQSATQPPAAPADSSTPTSPVTSTPTSSPNNTFQPIDSFSPNPTPQPGSFMDFSQPMNTFASTPPQPTDSSQPTSDPKPSLTPNLVKPPLPEDYNPAEFAPVETPPPSPEQVAPMAEQPNATEPATPTMESPTNPVSAPATTPPADSSAASTASI